MSSHPSSLLRVPVEMPNRSGHNLSHTNCFTGTTGTLIPVLCEELLPNDTISLGSALQVQLPPMVTDFYGQVDFVLEAFFVPNRLCWGGWSDFMTHPTANPKYPEGTTVASKPKRVPQLAISDVTSSGTRTIPVDSLLHYLDYGSSMDYSFNGYYGVTGLSVLPLIAYHRIWDDWYRDSRVQAPLFYRSNASESREYYALSLPFISIGNPRVDIEVLDTDTLGDGYPLTKLRQRNWVKDYFTCSSPFPQAGGASEVEFNTAGSTGAFSIATLRAANSLQKWMERNNIAGYRYSDQIYAQFGVYPSDAIMDRCLYLGRTIQTVYNRSVFSTGGDVTLGTKAANSQAIGEGSLIDKFTATEHGYIMVLASLVPRPVYGSGCERRNFRLNVGDFAFPLLAGMGDQAIYCRELTGYTGNTNTFGYTDLYAEYKFRNDKVHGLLRDDSNLSSFALQRSFVPDSVDCISSEFLLIPSSYLDQVQAVETNTQGYTYWAEIYFPYKKISTIPAYSQPTLANLEYAHKEYISRGGKRL